MTIETKYLARINLNDTVVAQINKTIIEGVVTLVCWKGVQIKTEGGERFIKTSNIVFIKKSDKL